jgi:hypothetical protein
MTNHQLYQTVIAVAVPSAVVLVVVVVANIAHISGESLIRLNFVVIFLSLLRQIPAMFFLSFLNQRHAVAEYSSLASRNERIL